MSSYPEDDETSARIEDESRPLLESQRPQKQAITPLPWALLGTLCLVRLADPIAFCQIFPYINEYIAYLHVTDDPSQIGFYSGLVESSFAVAQLLSIYTFSRLSDSIGRRPVIILGTFGVGIATVRFGLSTSLWGLMFSRSLSGLFAGTAAVNHAILGEITDHTNQAAAFPLYGLVWPLGGMIGPLIGGGLSEPAEKWDIFKDTIFETYPYFLPCFVAGCVSLMGFILAYAFLQETLPSKVKAKAARKDNRSRSSTQSSQTTLSGSNEDSTDSPKPIPKPKPSMLDLLSIPIIRSLSLAGFALETNATAFNVLFVLFCYTPVSHGGLGFSASKIGYSLAGSGIISTILQIFFLPVLLRRVEAAKVYNFSMGLWPLAFCLLPLLNVIARFGVDPSTGGVEEGTGLYVGLWVGIGVVLTVGRLAVLGFGVSMILVRNNAPDPEVLGATNGLVQLFMCLARTVSPTVVSSAFALSQEHNLLGGYLWVLLLVLFGIGSVSLTARIKNQSVTLLDRN